ncbi:MAG TPA: class I SAM-dependent methyltransferase [Chitinophagaceae bacterium]|nr:class I SAM-dependent methyltransferase [Chitinophagaceae bacterium]
MAMYDNDNTVRTSFDLNYISEYLQQAQWAELVELKKLISELAHEKGRPVSILDIGVGNARVPKRLSGIREIWEMVSSYDGTDNAKACIELAEHEINSLGIGNKTFIHFFDATSLDQWSRQHDLVICTWFTPGNFYPDGFSFEEYNSEAGRLDLSVNTKFTRIFSHAYQLLHPGGEIVLGACYIDNDSTRLKQEESYRKMGMTIITDEKDSFTATKEGFWSQRFTREKLFSYLPFIPQSAFRFTELDTYEYAWQVRIKKQ